MDTCPLCDRPLGDTNVDDHHLIPKTFKGKITVRLHRICHRKIHATFSERELLHDYHTIESLRAHETIKTFIKWVSKKDPGFYDGTKESNERKAKRRR